MHQRTCIAVLSAILLVPGPAALAAAPAPRSDRAAVVRTVMDQLVANHPDPFTHHDRAEFDAFAESIIDRADSLADHEFAVELLRLLALVGDGHTTLAGWWRLFPRAPIQIEVFEDGTYITFAHAEHEELIGARIDAIGETPIGEAQDRVAEVFASDNQWHRLFNFGYYLTMPAVLHARGLTTDPERFEAIVTLPDGERRAVTVPIAEGRSEWRTLPAEPDDQPLYRRSGQGIYWYEIITEHKTLYCRYDACRDDPKRPFAEFVNEMLAKIDEAGAERFVWDLRNNTGGASIVARPLMQVLARNERLNRPGHICVLIGRATFSSAMMNAYEIRQRTHAILVGEPTGGKPNSFGEIITVDLEGTDLQLQVSTKYFHAFTDSDPIAVFPDVEVTTSAEQFFAGEDPVLDAALSHVPDPTTRPGD